MQLEGGLRRHYRGYEPFDGLSSPTPRANLQKSLGRTPPATGGTAVAHKPSPLGRYQAFRFNKRPRNDGVGATFLLHRTTGNREYWTKAVERLKWLRRTQVCEVRKTQLGQLFRFLKSWWCLSQRRQHYRVDRPDRTGVPGSFRTIG